MCYKVKFLRRTDVNPAIGFFFFFFFLVSSLFKMRSKFENNLVT